MLEEMGRKYIETTLEEKERTNEETMVEKIETDFNKDFRAIFEILATSIASWIQNSRSWKGNKWNRTSF